MKKNTIEPRYGCGVYVGETGKVCIRQRQGDVEESIIILHHEEASQLIPMINNAVEEALDFVPEIPDENGIPTD